MANVTLRIDEGATLNGSPDVADYPLFAAPATPCQPK
jgi:polygalacturonase